MALEEFSCKVCLRKFKDPKRLKIHIRTHTGDRAFKCPYCSHTAITARSIRRHLKCKTRKGLQCPHCDSNFCTHESRWMHKRECHSLESLILTSSSPEHPAPSATAEIQWKAGKGAEKSVSLSPAKIKEEIVPRFIQSIMSDEGIQTKEMIHCSRCSFRCKDPSQLGVHTQFRRPGPPLGCHQCNFESCTSSGIMIHRMEVHFSLATTSSIDAAEVDKVSDQEIASYEHEPDFIPAIENISSEPEKTSIDETDPEDTCPSCKKWFKNKWHLKEHMRLHTGEKPFKCDKCSYASAHSSSLRHHKQSYSSTVLTCTECNFTSCTPATLQIHMKKTHVQAVASFCAPLQPAGPQAQALAEDVENSKEKDLEDFESSRRPNLRSLRDLLRNNQVKFGLNTARNPKARKSGALKRLFRCEHCSYKSSQRSHIVVHTRIHTGEKPYACSICPHRSAREHDMKMHELRHRGKRCHGVM